MGDVYYMLYMLLSFIFDLHSFPIVYIDCILVFEDMIYLYILDGVTVGTPPASSRGLVSRADLCISSGSKIIRYKWSYGL